MSFFPPEFNPREPTVGMLDLVKINTSGLPGYFMLGSDGTFKDKNGIVWHGSQTVSSSRLQSALDGLAPVGNIALSFFQDPEADNVIDSIKDEGDDYVKGKKIEFYIQPICSMEDFYNPQVAPILWMTRIMRTITYSASGAQNRTLGVTFEPWSERRQAARGLTYNTTGHSELIGEANPSFEFMPTNDFEEEKLFG